MQGLEIDKENKVTGVGKIITDEEQNKYNNSLKFKKLHPEAVIPQQAHEGDSGYDLIAIDEFGGILLDGKEESFINCGRHAKMYGPSNKNHRYLTEDVPFGLVYLGEVAKKIGVPSPNMNAISTLTSTVCGISLEGPLVERINGLPQEPGALRKFLYDG